MPERSPEIEQVLRDTLDAMVRSDVDEIGRHTSRDPCVLSIGSDASEWAEGYDEIMRLFRESTPEGLALTSWETPHFDRGEVRSCASRLVSTAEPRHGAVARAICWRL